MNHTRAVAPAPTLGYGLLGCLTCAHIADFISQTYANPSSFNPAPSHNLHPPSCCLAIGLAFVERLLNIFSMVLVCLARPTYPTRHSLCGLITFVVRGQHAAMSLRIISFVFTRILTTPFQCPRSLFFLQVIQDLYAFPAILPRKSSGANF